MAMLEWVEAALKGEPVDDFAESFPLVSMAQALYAEAHRGRVRKEEVEASRFYVDDPPTKMVPCILCGKDALAGWDEDPVKVKHAVCRPFASGPAYTAPKRSP
jgi:hypothetical protein